MKTLRSLFILVSLLLLTCFSTLHAQQVPLMRVAPLEELNSGGFIISITQDQPKYLQFFKQIGLFHYNAYEGIYYRNSSDNPETLAQPFLTTKPFGESNGLELSPSYEIMTKGHGRQLQTEKDEYAEFIITLPVIISEVAESAAV